MTSCRFCHAPLTTPLVDLGHQPPSNSYLKAADQDEKVYGLKAMVCDACHLVQLDTTVDPGEIFHDDYAYFSSFSKSWVAHAKAYADKMIAKLGLDENSKVVEAASNDGYLLQHFLKAGVPVLGVEPSSSVAEAAREKGVETIEAFFNVETAERLKNEGHGADLIAANNVLAHVPDINGFVGGFATLLKQDGVLTVEFPHLLNMLNLVQFDTIYHEHYFYLSLLSVEAVFKAHGLRVFDVEEISTHGGSLRVFACKANSTVHDATLALEAMRKKEQDAGLESGAAYQGFSDKVAKVREGLLAFLKSVRDEGKTVVGYGAAAKGNTLMNFCNIGADDIDFVVDANDWKQGRFLPGSRIPVLAPDHIKSARPDFVLILPWNLRDEISSQMAYIQDWGGQFVVAIPEIEVW
ncbi:MAG: class I SAM-dependent methyltransferase [Magnetovibrio sp.]|nr:class I SAM-dependent methyltransferase [Magnetovibrio sp.]